MPLTMPIRVVAFTIGARAMQCSRKDNTAGGSAAKETITFPNGKYKVMDEPGRTHSGEIEVEIKVVQSTLTLKHKKKPSYKCLPGLSVNSGGERRTRPGWEGIGRDGKENALHCSSQIEVIKIPQ